MEKKYTSEEVAVLLAAYSSSDSGNRCVEEVRREYRNSFPSMTEVAKKWLVETADLTLAEKAKIWFDQREPFFQEQLLMKWETVEEAYRGTFNVRNTIEEERDLFAKINKSKK
jgi:hypothetical protein